MNLSGILVLAAPARQADVGAAIAALNWAEVHHADDTGRLIVTVEAESSEAGLERLKALKRLPGVLAAELIVHYCGDEATADARRPPQSPLDWLNSDDGAPPRRSYYSRLKAVGNH